MNGDSNVKRMIRLFHKKKRGWRPAYRTFFITVLFCGCAAVGPDYVPPDTKLPPQWHSDMNSVLIPEPMDPCALAAWWTLFRDPVLDHLIETAVKGNTDLEKARLKIKEARLRRAASEADRFPTLNASSSHSYNRQADADDSLESPNNPGSRSSRTYYAGFDASWEWDVFGRVRRSMEASEAGLAAARENLRDVLVSLLAEVALNYVELRTGQARLQIMESHVLIQSEIYRLTQWRRQVGLSDELDLDQAGFQLETVRSRLPALRTAIQAAINRVSVLLGQFPDKIHGILTPGGIIPCAPENVAVGFPADLIRRRPDIRQAERILAEQTAKIGVAEADLYPRFTLGGDIGISALSPGSLSRAIPHPDRYGLGLGPRLTWTVFQGGAVRQSIQIQTALQEQALVNYETVILSAFEEVENALISFSSEKEKNRHLKEAEKSAASSLERAMQMFQSGLTDLSRVLDARQSFLNSQDDRNQSDGAAASHFIRIYKAMGGGWTSFDTENEIIPATGDEK